LSDLEVDVAVEVVSWEMDVRLGGVCSVGDASFLLELKGMSSSGNYVVLIYFVSISSVIFAKRWKNSLGYVDSQHNRNV
jgi:hypothetical protein